MLLFYFVIPDSCFEFEISLKIVQPFAETLDGLCVPISMEKWNSENIKLHKIETQQQRLH